MKPKKISKHRYLFDKAALLRKATADCAEHPKDEGKRLYVKGLCDALHGTTSEPIGSAIHVARQVIIAVMEVGNE
jgi:hypothetical protein